MGPHEEGTQLILGLEAAKAMQIDRSLNGIPLSRQPALTPGFERFRHAMRRRRADRLFSQGRR